MKIFILLLMSIDIHGATLQEELLNRKKSSKAPAEIKQEFKRATEELRQTGIEAKALSTGVKAPSFEIKGQNIKEFYKDKPIILKFYRGHWCPYCIIELKAYQKKLNEIEKYGQLVALVPDEELYIKKTKRDHSLSFEIYQDKNNQIAKKFGVAFSVDKKVLGLYNKFSIDLEKSQGNKQGELPMPGTYVINRKGKIVYAFYDADYTKRADPEKVITELKKAAQKEK